MDFEAFKDLILQRAKAFGFDDCELYCVSGSGMMLTIPAGEEYSIKAGVAFRGSVGDKIGSAYSENISEGAVDFLLASAYENASFAKAAPASYCSPGLTYPVLSNQDPELLDVSKVRGKRTEIVTELEKYPFLAKTTGVLYSLQVTARVINTRGLDVANTANYTFCNLFGVAERDGVLKDTLLYRSGSHLVDIDAAALLAEVNERAGGYFGASQVKTGKYNILFSNNCASYLVQGFSVFFSAGSVEKGLSLWKNRLGQKVANACVTIVDDPLDTRGVFARSHDAEGYPSATKTLIEAGVLKSYLHNVATAGKHQGSLPGNTWRLDYNYEPDIHPSNMYLAPGNKSFDDLLQELGDGLYVTDMTAYFHGAGINAISGDYSMPVTGFVVKNGRIDHPLDGVTIAGNLYQMMDQISAVGDDFLYGLPTSFRPGAPMGYGCYGSPSIIISDVSVGGE